MAETDEDPTFKEAIDVANKKAYKPRNKNLSYMILSLELTNEQRDSLIRNGWRYTNHLKLSIIAPDDWKPTGR